MKLVCKQLLKLAFEQRKNLRYQNINSSRNFSVATENLITDTELSSKVHSFDNYLTKDLLEPLVSSNMKFCEMTDKLRISRRTLLTYLKKFGLYKNTRPSNTPEIILDKLKLQELINDNKTLNEIAQELNVSVGKVRYYLDKYKIQSGYSDEFKAFKRYFATTSPEDKAIAYAEVDKFLKQIANEEFKLGKNVSYEDCLQDVRLRFLEIAENRKEHGSTTIKSTIERLKKNITIRKEEAEFCKLDLAHDKIDTDFMNFEDINFAGYLLNKIKDKHTYSWYLTEEYLLKGKTIEEIAESSFYSSSTIKEFIDECLEKLDKIRLKDIL